MRTFIFGLFILLVVNPAMAQKTQDKGAFVPYGNPFYSEIKKGIEKYNKGESEPRQSFKMDYSNKLIPKSTDEFTTVWCNDPLSQGRTGTCWCFATSSFYEAEIYRISKEEVKLSELYTVYYEYVDKAREYIRTRGTSFFGEGSETNAVARMMKKHGIVPAKAYNGMKDGQEFHDHKTMYHEMKQYLESLKRDNAWNEEEGLATIRSILDYYIGVPPAKFNYNGKEYTPQSFLADVAQLNPDDYVDFMSLLEKPFYTKAEYKVPDNWWRSDSYHNVPVTDFMSIIKSGLKKGYSFSIGGDVSESGYSPSHDAAMVPAYDIPSEYIDDNARQFRFSNGSTTDDHAIHLVGYKDSKNGTWFLIKDSGSGSRNGKNKGYYFYHEDYVKLKIMTYTVHKDAAQDILKKFKK